MVERHFEVIQETGESLDIELRLEDFRPQEEELTERFPERFPDSPVGLELVDWWCCTVNEDTGLEITHVELDAGSSNRTSRRTNNVYDQRMQHSLIRHVSCQ